MCGDSPLMSISSLPPAPGGPTEPIINPPASATPATSPNPPPPSDQFGNLSIPVKQKRQFSSGSPAYTTWYTTTSAKDLEYPPKEVDPTVGELYIHHNRLEDRYQVWLYGLDSVWKCITNVEKVYHPTIDDRVLSMRANGTPNWITSASYTTIRGRKCRKMPAE